MRVVLSWPGPTVSRRPGPRAFLPPVSRASVVIGSVLPPKKRGCKKRAWPNMTRNVQDWRGKRPRMGRGRPNAHRESRETPGPVVLYGWHSVTAALANPRRKILRILATENALRRLQEEGIPLPCPPELVRP